MKIFICFVEISLLRYGNLRNADYVKTRLFIFLCIIFWAALHFKWILTWRGLFINGKRKNDFIKMLTVSRLIFHFFNEKTLLHYTILYGINIFHNLSNFRCPKCQHSNLENIRMLVNTSYRILQFYWNKSTLSWTLLNQS